jgi:hypothetical protein
MRLSKRQAQRLWNLDARTADDIFDALEASNFLKRVTGGAYMRADIADRCRSRNFAREHAHPRPEHPTVV